MPKLISLHDVLEPLEQALLASRDVIISSQICGSNLQRVFTLGDGCWLPIDHGFRAVKYGFLLPLDLAGPGVVCLGQSELPDPNG